MHSARFMSFFAVLQSHLSVTVSRQLVPNQQVQGLQPPSRNEVSQQRLAPPDFSTSYISISTQISEVLATTSCKSSGDVIWIVTSLSTGMSSNIFQSSSPTQHSEASHTKRLSREGGGHRFAAAAPRTWFQLCDLLMQRVLP